MTCFEKRLGCFQAEHDSFQQRMIDSAEIIFTSSRKLKYLIFFVFNFTSFSVLLVIRTTATLMCYIALKIENLGNNFLIVEVENIITRLHC